jgi:hypothetical protein
MRQVTYIQPRMARVRTRGALLLAAVVLAAGLATSAFLAISERGATRHAGYNVVSGTGTDGVRHDGGYYRVLSRRRHALSRRAANSDRIVEAMR